MSRIVLASGNAGKLREIEVLCETLPVSFVSMTALGIESPEETGKTFVDNALLKARHSADASNLPAIADDSGISVDALGGAPGVYSARFAGVGASDDQNLDKLLDELGDVADAKRGAQFHCAAVLAFPDEREPLIVEAAWRGRILRERRGSGGFGYDPVFLDPELGKTGAELSRDAKNAVSHRGKAFALLREQMRLIDWSL